MWYRFSAKKNPLSKEFSWRIMVDVAVVYCNTNMKNMALISKRGRSLDKAQNITYIVQIFTSNGYVTVPVLYSQIGNKIQKSINHYHFKLHIKDIILFNVISFWDVLRLNLCHLIITADILTQGRFCIIKYPVDFLL